jgi:glucan biosynthesis protein C
MKVQPNKTKRIHSLDSLRAIMMLLGLVIHSAITYGVLDYGNAWSLKDNISTSLSNDFIVNFIHAFRMQTFFLVAGFFGAMLFYERRPKKMIKNRIARIIIPFVVFVILLWPTIIFSFTYTNAIFDGNQNAFTDTLSMFSSPSIFIPKATFHLWFLYYLSVITMISVLIALIFLRLPKTSNHIKKLFRWIFSKPLLRIFIFACVTTLSYFIMQTTSVETSPSFILDFNTLLYYFIFYIIGWALYKSKEYLDTFMKYDWLSTIMAIILFCIYFFLDNSLSYELVIVLKSVMVWFFIFGITGVFIRYGSKHSSIMRYISDSSYWVYLIHLTFTAILPSLIADWTFPATFKFLIVLITTSTICFVSYHYLVRGTYIGKFLNGRTYSKKLSDIKQMEKLNTLKPTLDK